MVRLGVACPALAVSPAAAAALRAEGLGSLQGLGPAPTRYARGLSLGASSEADARAQATRDGAACVHRQRGFALLLCTRTLTRAGASAAFDDGAGAGDGTGSEETTFSFDERDRLISVDVLRRFAPSAGDDAERIFHMRAAALASSLGVAGERAGDVRTVRESATPFATALVRHRYSDYLAAVTLVRLDGGLAVREVYQSAAAAPPSAS